MGYSLLKEYTFLLDLNKLGSSLIKGYKLLLDLKTFASVDYLRVQALLALWVLA